jgi:hypothetical protein
MTRARPHARSRLRPTKGDRALEQAEPEIISDLRALTPEERRDLLRRWNEEPDEAAEAGG